MQARSGALSRVVLATALCCAAIAQASFPPAAITLRGVIHDPQHRPVQGAQIVIEGASLATFRRKIKQLSPVV